MAKTTYISVAGVAEELFYKNVQSGDRLVTGSIKRKKTLFSRRSVKGLSLKTLLPQISALWNNLTENDKTAWSEAGAMCGLNGYRLFVQDTSARIKNGLPGVATPSLLHQCWVGELKVSAPSTELKIEQMHPNSYWVSRKVAGKKGMYQPVKVTESFALPLKIKLSYKSNLVACGPNPAVDFYAEVWHSYQGVDLFENLVIPLDLQTDWKSAEATLPTVIGQSIGYTLYFHLYNVRGNLLIDNVQAIHNEQNWVRDTYCNNIQQTFTKAFYQIPKNWASVILPNGSEYATIYV